MTPLETGLLTAIPNYCGVATADGVTRGGVPVTAFNDRPVVWRLNNASSSYTAPHHLPQCPSRSEPLCNVYCCYGARLTLLTEPRTCRPCPLPGDGSLPRGPPPPSNCRAPPVVATCTCMCGAAPASTVHPSGACTRRSGAPSPSPS